MPTLRKTTYTLGVSIPANASYTYSNIFHGVVHLHSSDPVRLKNLIVRFKGTSGANVPLIYDPDYSPVWKRLSTDLFDSSFGLVKDLEPLSAGTHDWDFWFEWPARGTADLIANFGTEFQDGAEFVVKYEVIATACVVDSKGLEQVLDATRSLDFIGSRGEESPEPDMLETTVKLIKRRSIIKGITPIIGAGKQRGKAARQQLPEQLEHALAATLQTPEFGWEVEL